MPWDEIDAGAKDAEIGEMKKLIEMRKTLQSCKSRNFHFPNDVPQDRVISYLKIGEEESIQIYLNCEETDVQLDLSEFSEVVYSRKWNGTGADAGVLSPNGILILKK
jgi:hypothetical protein